MKSIIRNYIAKLVAGRSDDGIMITLKDPKKNIKFIFNYFLCKIKYLYVRLLYNKLYSKN